MHCHFICPSFGPSQGGIVGTFFNLYPKGPTCTLLSSREPCKQSCAYEEFEGGRAAWLILLLIADIEMMLFLAWGKAITQEFLLKWFFVKPLLAFPTLPPLFPLSPAIQSCSHRDPCHAAGLGRTEVSIIEERELNAETLAAHPRSVRLNIRFREVKCQKAKNCKWAVLALCKEQICCDSACWHQALKHRKHFKSQCYCWLIVCSVKFYKSLSNDSQGRGGSAG